MAATKLDGEGAASVTGTRTALLVDDSGKESSEESDRRDAEKATAWLVRRYTSVKVVRLIECLGWRLDKQRRLIIETNFESRKKPIE